MKIKKFISESLKVLGYFLGILGGFLAYGFVGGLENDQITISQFWLYELLALGLIVLAFIVYIIRGEFNNKYLNK